VENVVTKAEFARLSGVSKARVSQWISAGQLSGGALVAAGRGEKIHVAVARRQLGRRLDIDQRLSARSAVAGDTLEALQRARLAQLELANERVRAEAAVHSGHHVLAADARQEVGRVAGRLVAAFEGALPELASAVATICPVSQRDVLHAMRGAWLTARARLAAVEAAAAVATPELVEAAQ
jgi:DNA-binding transcriptional regulator YdaS (Cro superfamily)